MTGDFDHTPVVRAFNELHRRSFKTPPTKEAWSVHDKHMELDIELLNDGEIDALIGWVFTSESVEMFQGSGWVLMDQEGDAVRLDHPSRDASIYIAPAGDKNLTWLDE